MHRPKVAVLGCGYWGQNLVRNFFQLGSLDLICDAAEAGRSRAREIAPEVEVLDNFETVFKREDIKAVVLATPADTHFLLALAALRAGKDVLVEKPLALTPGNGAELVDSARQKNIVLMVGHLLWYHPAIIKLKEIVDSGELGRILYIYSNRLNLGKIRREENILWSFAPHDISVILGLLGEMPTQVLSHGGNYLHQKIADVTVSCLSFSSGVKAHIFVSWLHPFKEQKLVVVGEKKMAVFDDLEPRNKLTLYPHSITWRNQIPVANKAAAEPVETDPGEPLRAECAHFLECIQTRNRPRTDGEEGLRVLTVLQQCQDALNYKP